MSTNFRSGFGWNFAFNLFTKIATPLISVYVARKLGPEIMGAYLILPTVMTFTDVFRDSLFMRVYLRDPKGGTPEVDHDYAALSIVGHFILALIVAGLAIPLANDYHQPELKGGLLLAALAVAINGFSALPYTRLLKDGHFKKAGFAEAVGSVASSLIALVWVVAGGGFWALAMMGPIRSVIFLALTFRHSPYRISRPRREFARKIAGSSTILSATNIMWVGFSFGDQLLVSHLFGIVSGGVYGAGKMMVQTADVLAKPITQTVTVAFAERKADPERVRATLYKSLLTFLIAIAPIYVAVAVFARPLVIGILSEKYAATAGVLPPLCLYFAVVYPGSFASDSLVMAGKERIPFAGWILTYIYLAAVLIVGSMKGMELVTCAWLLTSGLVFVNTSTLIFALSHYRADSENKKGLGAAVLALATTALIACLTASLPISDPGKVAVGIIAVPMTHLLATGTLFNHNPISMFRLSGVKELWGRL